MRLQYVIVTAVLVVLGWTNTDRVEAQSGAEPTPAYALDDYLFLPTGFGPFDLDTVLDNDWPDAWIEEHGSASHGTVTLDGLVSTGFEYLPDEMFVESSIDAFSYRMTSREVKDHDAQARTATVFVLHESARYFFDDAESGVLPSGWSSAGIEVTPGAAIRGGYGFGVPLIPNVAVQAFEVLPPWFDPTGNNKNNDGTMMVTTIDGGDADLGDLPVSVFSVTRDDAFELLVLELRLNGIAKEIRLRAQRDGGWVEGDWQMLPPGPSQVAVHWWSAVPQQAIASGTALAVNNRMTTLIDDVPVVPFDTTFWRIGVWNVGTSAAGRLALDDLGVFRFSAASVAEFGPLAEGTTINIDD